MAKVRVEASEPTICKHNNVHYWETDELNNSLTNKQLFYTHTQNKTVSYSEILKSHHLITVLPPFPPHITYCWSISLHPSSPDLLETDMIENPVHPLWCPSGFVSTDLHALVTKTFLFFSLPVIKTFLSTHFLPQSTSSPLSYFPFSTQTSAK